MGLALRNGSNDLNCASDVVERHNNDEYFNIVFGDVLAMTLRCFMSDWFLEHLVFRVHCSPLGF